MAIRLNCCGMKPQSIYLTLMTEDAPQRDYPLREVFNGLRWIVRTGAPWRWMPHDLPPWQVVYQQSRRWIEAGVFESLVHDMDMRAVLRIAEGRKENPTAAIIATAKHKGEAVFQALVDLMGTPVLPFLEGSSP